jgi:class 3 adenylate cyclase
MVPRARSSGRVISDVDLPGQGPTDVVNGTGLKQRLAAILAADAAGYSRLMASDDRATVAALDVARGVFRSRIEAHQGRVIDMAGDSVLAVFQTAAGAVAAAIDVQQELASPRPPRRRSGRCAFASACTWAT